jgi:DNA polymerase-3 subunit alpha
MSTSSCLTNPKHMQFPFHEFYFKEAAEMQKIFRESKTILTNTYDMSERVDIDDIKKNLFGGMRLPNIEVPDIEKIAWDGLKNLGWDKSTLHVEALKKELNDVKIAKQNNNYDFYKYFAIVADYAKFARDQDIVVGCGRGSGYASVLLRCLKISYGPDPIKYGLLWERFLGFDDKKFIKSEDFGFNNEGENTDVVIPEDTEDEIIEQDFGGINRY